MAFGEVVEGLTNGDVERESFGFDPIFGALLDASEADVGIEVEIEGKIGLEVLGDEGAEF